MDEAAHAKAPNTGDEKADEPKNDENDGDEVQQIAHDSERGKGKWKRKYAGNLRFLGLVRQRPAQRLQYSLFLLSG